MIPMTKTQARIFASKEISENYFSYIRADIHKVNLANGKPKHGGLSRRSELIISPRRTARLIKPVDKSDDFIYLEINADDWMKQNESVIRQKEKLMEANAILMQLDGNTVDEVLEALRKILEREKEKNEAL